MNASEAQVVQDDELLARFIVSARWIRSDNTIKQDAFRPPSDLELSVTRHTDISIEELWQLGKYVAEKRQLQLIGRGDLTARNFRQEKLNVIPQEPPNNHAVVKDWPLDIPTQKIIAMRLAQAAQYVAAPASRE